MEKSFKKIAKITLILMYSVIAAGAIVRMTGSGMGCPDWPKCFGYYIPPTEEYQLLWQPNKHYKKGQVIIRNESLYVAVDDFITMSSYNENQWEPYTKHNYAVFNPYHTWIEFINRLLGVLAGAATLVMAFFSFGFRKTQKRIILLSWLAVFGMGFQGWLGATVVYSVLAPLKVTLHMVVALCLVAIILYILHYLKKGYPLFKPSMIFKWGLLLAFILTMVQIVLGTQVREFIDVQYKALGDNARHLWLNDPPLLFYIHRSFSLVVLLLNSILFLYQKQKQLGYLRMSYVMILFIVEICSGIVMNYADFPFGSQAIHLFIAFIIFGVQFFLILDVNKVTRSIKNKKELSMR